MVSQSLVLRKDEFLLMPCLSDLFLKVFTDENSIFRQFASIDTQKCRISFCLFFFNFLLFFFSLPQVLYIFKLEVNTKVMEI